MTQLVSMNSCTITSQANIRTGRYGMKRVGMVGFILLGMIFLSNSVHAEIYKWVDENGKVHFSDRKIVTQAEKVNVKTGSTSSAQANKAETLTQNNQISDAAEKSVEARILEKQKYVNFLRSERLEREEKRKQAQAEKDKKKKLCAAMQDKLKSYSQGNFRWYELDESTGERKYISDDQLEVKKKKLKTDINKQC